MPGLREKTVTYYNEIDPYCCEWLKSLMSRGLIPRGDVDNRSITEVSPDDLTPYTQCHFFAGIAGWAYAARLAGWPDSTPLWTGSCPCQPFSLTGKKEGFEDQRDLWPAWFRLIAECLPPDVMGEQVASAVDWRARMRSDLERAGYAVGSKPVQAASAGACQLRDRLWFVAGRDSGQRWSELPSIISDRDAKQRDESTDKLTWSGVGLFAGLDGTRFIKCPDGKFRRLPPSGIRLLGNGVPSRVAKLRAFGNAIYPPLAAKVIRAYMDGRLPFNP